MIKLVRIVDDTMLYWQSWTRGRELFVYDGVVGQTGSINQQKTISASNAQSKMNKLCEQQINQHDFELIDDDNLESLILQLQESDDLDTDFDRRNLFMEDLDQLMGWIGAGHVDGCDSGSGTMNIFLRTVSTSRTVQTILQWIEEQGMLDEIILASEANNKNLPVKILWPTDFEGQFK